MPNTPKKRGQLSLTEEAYIRDQISTSTVAEIAEYLNRTTGPIERYINENAIISSEDQTSQDILRYKLRSKTFWPEIIKQFDEIPAEELQIKQFITIDILINRSMKDRKRHISETEKLQSQVDQEYDKPEDSRDIPKLANLETQLSFARNSIASYTNEYTKLLNEQQKISKDLKATREQRIKRIEDGKNSWTGLIRMLEDEVAREKEGRSMEILALAAAQSKQSLYEYHTYQDQVIDRPFLTPDSVVQQEKQP